jgi:hypothetical protein
MLGIQALQADFLPFLDLQSLLLNISESTYAETRDLLISLDYISDSKLSEFLLLLLQTIDRRPRQTSFYVD